MELLTDNTVKNVSFYKSMGFKPADEIGCLSFTHVSSLKTKLLIVGFCEMIKEADKC